MTDRPCEGSALHVMRVHYTGTEADAAPFVAAHVEYLRRHHATAPFWCPARPCRHRRAG
ncbi:hypothetical protein [Saccharomonospora cyanea]|uniref:hypothetical protein n=1 Tax=Saccharomonospora cyanea TaxID=40989 RepID=UPI001E3998A2|nr:hypothetical protein [Saccharomonospora cyanea]